MDWWSRTTTQAFRKLTVLCLSTMNPWCIYLACWFYIYKVPNFILFYFFWGKKKGTCVWQSLSHAPRYSWVSPWVPPAWSGAQKLRTHTHPRLYWFLGLPEIAITVLVKTRTWDVMKPKQSPIMVAWFDIFTSTFRWVYKYTYTYIYIYIYI